MIHIRAVVFDVGECLVDETREYGTWADWLGVPRHTFHAVFGAVIAQGRDYREVFQEFRPGRGPGPHHAHRLAGRTAGADREAERGRGLTHVSAAVR
jgi:hypothetical protein